MLLIQEVSQNFKLVEEKLLKACHTSGKSSSEVSLIAISKNHSSDSIRIVLNEGHRIFGESRIQESVNKWTQLKAEYSNIELHLIGPLQTNKIRKAVEFFDVIQSVDRIKVAELLSKEMQNLKRFPKCLIQINTGEEAQKSGISSREADTFINTCINELNLPIAGVMCIPPVDIDPTSHFELLREIAKRHQLSITSMGMSRDYETAIRCGATHVRVGSAIFGQRTM